MAGLIATDTGIEAVPPLPSETATVKESVLAVAAAPVLAAACRAAAVGV